MSLRLQNQCNSCAYTGYPRDKHLSLRCPGCGGRNIGVVQPPRSSSGCGPVLLVAFIVVVAIVWAVSRSGGNSSSPSSAPEPIAASGADAAGQAAPPITASDGAIAPSSEPGPVSVSDSNTASDISGTNPEALNDASAPALAGGSPQKAVYATSFDCAKATHEDEIAICGDPGLAAMDVELAQLYQSTLATISDPKALAQSESGWLVARQMCDGDLDCLRRAYGERIGQFKGSLGSPPLLPVGPSQEKP